MRELSPEQMARLTQIDYDREMAFVAVREASGETVGVARLVCEDERSGEFAVIVQADMKGRGVASHLMRRLIDWARARGLREIVGPGAGGQRTDAGLRAASRISRAAHAGGAGRGGGAAGAGVVCRQWKRPPCASPAADLRAARRHAILYVLAASATFTLGSALVKALTVDFPVLEIVMFRSIVGFVAMLPMIVRGGGLSALKTRRPVGHVMRTVYGFIGTVTSVYGFGVLPLVTVTALGFAMPLFLTIVSVPLLGERVGPRRATAVLVGLVGVMVMLRPWHVDADSMPLGAVAIVLAGVFTWSLSMINIRQMGDAGERNVTIVAWYSLGTAALAAFGCITDWVTPIPGSLPRW